MSDSIFQGLLSGRKFSYSTLRDHPGEIAEFLKIWWGNHSPHLNCNLAGPETLLDDDEILDETRYKERAILSDISFPNPATGFAFFSEGLSYSSVPRRDAFQDYVAKYLFNNSPRFAEGGFAVFCGGGNGAGKSSSLKFIYPDSKRMPIFGADMIKDLIPEYHQIQQVGDWRASLVVHEEAVQIVNKLMRLHVASGHAFVLDSTMSNVQQTLERLAYVKGHGYVVRLVGVCTDLAVARKRCMERAQGTFRFITPQSFVSTHREFALKLPTFLEFAEEAHLFWNSDGSRDPRIMARKSLGDSNINVLDQDAFERSMLVDIV